VDTISSFLVDHTRLLPGLYVSRIDKLNNDIYITTFDIRLRRPNVEPVLNTTEIHTIEHMAATYLRNHKQYGNKIIYFGPMGCRTGFYLIMSGSYKSADIRDLVEETFKFIVNFNGEVPGSKKDECGNYRDLDLGMAKSVSVLYLDNVISNKEHCCLDYPE